MKNLLTFGLLAGIGSLLVSGCTTTPAQEGQVYSAYAVGDRTRVALDEIVVSLPVKGATAPYQNLHIGLAAAINPIKTSSYGPYAITDIMQRLEGRIGARLTEALTSLKEQSLEGMPALRTQITAESQAVVDQAMQRWQHGSEYEVKILVVSLYWTDSSVGRVPAARRTWWW